MKCVWIIWWFEVWVAKCSPLLYAGCYYPAGWAGRFIIWPLVQFAFWVRWINRLVKHPMKNPAGGLRRRKSSFPRNVCCICNIWWEEILWNPLVPKPQEAAPSSLLWMGSRECNSMSQFLLVNFTTEHFPVARLPGVSHFPGVSPFNRDGSRVGISRKMFAVKIAVKLKSACPSPLLPKATSVLGILQGRWPDQCHCNKLEVCIFRTKSSWAIFIPPPPLHRPLIIHLYVWPLTDRQNS